MKKTILLLLALRVTCACLFAGCHKRSEPEPRLNLFSQVSVTYRGAIPVVYGAKFFQVPEPFIGRTFRIQRVKGGKTESVFERRLEDPHRLGDFYITTFFSGYNDHRQSVEIIFRPGIMNQDPVYQCHCPDGYMLQQYSLSRSHRVEIPMVIDVISMCPLDKEWEYRSHPDLDEEDILAFSRKHTEGVFYILKIEKVPNKAIDGDKK